MEELKVWKQKNDGFKALWFTPPAVELESALELPEEIEIFENVSLSGEFWYVLQLTKGYMFWM